MTETIHIYSYQDSTAGVLHVHTHKKNESIPPPKRYPCTLMGVAFTDHTEVLYVGSCKGAYQLLIY